MRIFLIHYYLQKPNPAYGELARALRARGHCIWLGSPDSNFDLSFHDGAETVAVVRRCRRDSETGIPPENRVETRHFSRRLRTFINRHQPDIVQINPAGMPYVWIMPLGSPARTRWIIDWRQIAVREPHSQAERLKYAARHRWRQFYSRHLYDCATFLHTAGAEKFLGSQWARWSQVVPLGVGQNFLDYAAATAPNEIGRTVRFIYVGSLSKVRQLECLFEAAKTLHTYTDQFKLVFVGPDNSDGYYVRLRDKMELADVVDIHHPVPYRNIPEVVLAHDVAIAYVPDSPIDWQYHPTLKVLEYRALGMPVLATDVAPNRDSILPNRNGLLVRNDADAWATAMLRYVDDGGFLTASRIAAQSLRTGLSWSEVARLYEETVYRNADTGHEHIIITEQAISGSDGAALKLE